MSVQLTRDFRHSVCGLAFAASVVLAPNVAFAGCNPSGEMPADQVKAFLADPASVLSTTPGGGGPTLISKIRDLVASDPATLQPVLNLLKNAGAGQKEGIGKGLKQAATACLGTDQAFANEIQQKLTVTGDREAMVAYQKDKDDNDELDTASIGGGSSGGGNGGPTTGITSATGGGNSGTPQQSPGGINTTPTNYFTNLGVNSSAVLSTSAF